MDAPYPDSPESVALMLFSLLFACELGLRHNENTKAWALDLYAECLRAVRGHREVEVQRRPH